MNNDAIPIVTLTVLPTDLNATIQRADIYLAQNEALALAAGHAFSRSQIKFYIEKRLIKVNGELLTKAGSQLKSGDIIEITIPPAQKLDLTPSLNDNVRVLFEDEYLAVVYKPAGLSVHPSDTETNPTLVHDLLGRLNYLSSGHNTTSISLTIRPGIVHRIDKGTSGILVISKTDEAHGLLAKQFKDHTIERTYKTLVYGKVSNKLFHHNGSTGRIVTPFGRHPTNRKKMTGKLPEEKTHRKAVTNFAIEQILRSKSGDYFSFIRCWLETGRTHQIRVHLSELGYPIVCDPLYANPSLISQIKAVSLRKQLQEINHQLLHAMSLRFQHPILKQDLYFEHPIPSDFDSVIKQLEPC